MAISPLGIYLKALKSVKIFGGIKHQKNLCRGRCGRREFWWIFFFDNLFVYLLLRINFYLLKTLLRNIDSCGIEIILGVFFFMLGSFFFFIITTDAYCIALIKRLHDLGYSGGCFFILVMYSFCTMFLRFFQPIDNIKSYLLVTDLLVSAVFLFVLAKKGMSGPNKYGDSPLA